MGSQIIYYSPVYEEAKPILGFKLPGDIFSKLAPASFSWFTISKALADASPELPSQ